MIRIRALHAHDRLDILHLLRETRMFTKAEVDVALELVDLALTRPDQKDYCFRVAENEEHQTAGYVCYGPTPLTEGTYDLYWIAVAPRFQGKGIGRLLLQDAEEDIRRRGGRLVIIETSSQEKYAPTQRFYLNNGYTISAQIKDFYRTGDDRCIFTKYLTTSNN